MHTASMAFWECYNSLPERIQELANRNFEPLKGDPGHPSLRFKKISDRLWSVRVGTSYRVLATEVDEGLLRFWIGSHADYDRLIS